MINLCEMYYKYKSISVGGYGIDNRGEGRSSTTGGGVRTEWGVFARTDRKRIVNTFLIETVLLNQFGKGFGYGLR